MILFYNALLFLATVIGGSFPIWKRKWFETNLRYLLAFSAAFLLSITFLHLVPESFEDIGNSAGILIIVGFFAQHFFQKFTHGMEHGHVHSFDEHHHSSLAMPILLGLSIHAFSEGIPLGISYTAMGALPSLFLAIALHKLPESMLIISLFYAHSQSKKNTIGILILFSLITPFSCLITYYLGNHFEFISFLTLYLLPVISGIFIHISTTIFFESGTKAHEMTFRKWILILAGIALGLLSFLGSH